MNGLFTSSDVPSSCTPLAVTESEDGVNALRTGQFTASESLKRKRDTRASLSAISDSDSDSDVSDSSYVTSDEDDERSGETSKPEKLEGASKAVPKDSTH